MWLHFGGLRRRVRGESGPLAAWMFRLCRLFLCAAAAVQTSGCVLLGQRYLSDDWQSANVLPESGFHLPIGLRMGEDVGPGTWATSVGFLEAYDINDGSEIREYSIGLWISPWARGKWVWPYVGTDLEPVTMTYLGGGVSYLVAYFDNGTSSDRDESLGWYVNCGLWHTICRFLGVGAELRYTFGTSLRLHSKDMEADGLHILFQVGFPIYF